MLKKKQIEEVIKLTPSLCEQAEMLNVSERTLSRYKTKYKLSNLSNPVNINDIILSTLQNKLLQIKDFSKEYKIKEEEIYKIISSLENKGYPIEKSLSGYYINSKPKEQDLIIQHHVKKIKLGIVSDSHLCSRDQQLTYLNRAYDIMREEGIKIVLNAGDIIDGESVYGPLHKYEVFKIGADEQINYAIDNYPCRKGITTFAISGNHDLNYLKIAGIDAVKKISEKRNDIKYCGRIGAYIEFGEKTKVYLYHPDGGNSYALSYKVQKFISNLALEKQPQLLIVGHYHQSAYFKVQNTKCILSGCFQSQTEYLKRKGLDPQIGFWIADLTINEEGEIGRIKLEWIDNEFEKPIYRDYK